MAHRGPDGAGIWRDGNIALGHRRLIVIDPSPAAHQPMRSGDGRHAIVYNGELYNDAEVRAALAAEGVGCSTASDTETMLAALRRWGAGAATRLRGMYAFVLADTGTQTLLAARDPLGIKPLYYFLGEADGRPLVVIASEIPAILAHPAIRARPDAVGVSTYLTTIRTVLGARTMFDGVRAVRPGQVLRFDLSGDSIRVDDVTLSRATRGGEAAEEDAPARVREAIGDSVRRHLRSDVPLCCLLSGGLDSAIVATIAQRGAVELHTYCSGAPTENGESDFAYARLVASRLGTRHTEAPVTREMFAGRWEEMVRAMGVPLSTPNEVAINEVARRLRADGKIVTLSGEGADELFGGYEAPMVEAARFEGATEGEEKVQSSKFKVQIKKRARFQLDSNAWVGVGEKSAILAEAVWKALEGDDALIGAYEREFEAAWHDGPHDDPLQGHLRFHRRVNLVGLLGRLDTATMLAGVEGRTPFADVEVAWLAESLPMSWKWEGAEEEVRRERGDHAECAEKKKSVTKRVLREAFSADLPAQVVTRAKASFPLPFQEWVEDQAAVLRRSALAREWFTEAAVETVAREPGKLWRLAWPMINVALWGSRWW